VRRLSAPAVLFLLVLALGWSAPAAPARAADGNVGLVIASGTGQVQTYCFSVPPAGIAGLDLLQRTGLPLRVDYVSLGAQICAINGVGCLDPNQPCACQCQGTPCVYWQYAHWRNDHWVASTVGASSYIVKPGSVEGWGWGANPPPPSGNALCALAAPATPTARLAPPHTPRPTRLPASPTPRPPPTRTPAPPPPLPSATVAAPATEQSATPVPLPPTATPMAATATVAPTDTPRPTATAPASASATPARVVSATPEATATFTTMPPTPAPAAAGPPATYWLFGVLALALVGVIAWARTGRSRG